MRNWFRVGGGLLLGASGIAYGGFAWREAEDRALSAAEAEGRALLGAVACGVESSVDASAAVEELMGERLFDEAGFVATRLAEAPGLEEDVLRAHVEERRLVGAAFLDSDLGIVAAVDGSRGEAAREVGSEPASPFEPGRLARLDIDSLVGRLRSEGLGARDRVVVGFEKGPFGARTQFAVAMRAAALSGFVVLRADASGLERFRRDVGVARVLRESARAPGIASLLVQDEDGTCVAADDPDLVGAVLPSPPSLASWRSQPDGRRTLDIAMPVTWTGGPRGHLRVALDAAPVEAVVEESRRSICGITAVALACGWGGLLALAAVERRRRDAEARLREELAQRERFAAMGRLAAEVAHEVRGPLNAVVLNAQLLVREAARASPERLGELSASIRGAVARVDSAVQGLFDLGRPAGRLTTRPTDLAEIVRQAAASEGGQLRTEAPSVPVVVSGDVRMLATAVANLVRNARQAAPPESVRVSWRRERGEAVLDVDDRGPGVPAARRHEVFEAFRTTRPDGVGLGLSLVRDAVERHGGRVEVLDAPGGGARFRVRLPAEPAT